VPTYETRLLDTSGRPVHDGEPGTLWVRGGSRLLGYWNGRGPGASLAGAGPTSADWLCTGDTLMRDPDGYYRFCGRANDTFKVSGMWVAPADVEAVLHAHPAVARAAVIAKGSPPRLMAYLVLSGVGPPADDAEALRDIWRSLRTQLPPHEWPSGCLVVSEIPLTPTGKVDRAALLALPLDPVRDAAPDDVRPAPRTETEQQLAGIWATVLARDVVTRDDDFVELGGDSIAAFECLVAIRRAWAIDLPVGLLLADTAQLASVADAIDRLRMQVRT
jgi:acyl carrier protein